MSIHVCSCMHHGVGEWHLRYPGMSQEAAQGIADKINSGMLDGKQADRIAALESELAQARNETAMLRDVLMRSGFVPCDIPACNCGSFHHRYGLPERMNELRDALVDADVLDNSTGNLPLNAVKKLHMQRDEAQAWKRAIDDLLATWYTTADSYATPREAVKALIAFEVMTALDPKVSSDAAALVEQARMEEREAWSKWADAVLRDLELRSKIHNDPYLEISQGRLVELDTLRARKS